MQTHIGSQVSSWQKEHPVPQLGCNYSQPLMELLRAGSVDVDWIKIAWYGNIEKDLAATTALRPDEGYCATGTWSCRRKTTA